MMLKTIALAIALSCVAMAQNIVGGPGESKPFHGVSIGGTVDGPTFVNNSGKSVMAYVAQRITDNGINPTFTVPDLHSLVIGSSLDGPLGLFIGARSGGVNPETGQRKMEGNPIRYEVIGVLFADGQHFGEYYDEISRMFADFRTFSKSMQSTQFADRRTTLERVGGALDTLIAQARSRKGGQQISVDYQLMKNQEQIAQAFLGLPENEWDAAFARVASLPDVVKGE